MPLKCCLIKDKSPHTLFTLIATPGVFCGVFSTKELAQNHMMFLIEQGYEKNKEAFLLFASQQNQGMFMHQPNTCDKPVRKTLVAHSDAQERHRKMVRDNNIMRLQELVAALPDVYEPSKKSDLREVDIEDIATMIEDYSITQGRADNPSFQSQLPALQRRVQQVFHARSGFCAKISFPRCVASFMMPASFVEVACSFFISAYYKQVCIYVWNRHQPCFNKSIRLAQGALNTLFRGESSTLQMMSTMRACERP